MAKPFDATTKHLLESHPADWLALAGLPVAQHVTAIDADLSSFSVSADKVIRVDGPAPYIAHFEPQTWFDVGIDGRTVMYNALLRWRTGLPVRSVVIFLRPEAWSAAMTGDIVDSDEAGDWLKFKYKVVKVWELAPEALLNGGIGTVPLAPIAAVSPEQLPDIARRMEQRLAAENPAVARELETAAYILMGLRYSKTMVDRVLEGVKHMKESVTYQAILEEGEARGVALGEARGVALGEARGVALGEARGEVEGRRALLLLIGGKRFGPPTPSVRSKIQATASSQELESLASRVLDVSNWDDLFAPAR